jgi:hypothetical protein
MRARAGLAVALLGAAVPAGAQTNDHFFRSWRWTREEVSARAAALGGAAVALADDSVAARVNPAGLGSLGRTEVSAQVLRRNSATTPAGDELVAGVSLGSLAGAGRLGERWAAGLYVAETRHARLTIPPLALPDGLTDDGDLEVRVREAGLAASWRAAHGLQLGGRLSVGHAAVSGEYRREAPGQPTHLRVGTGGSDTRLTGAVGAAWEPSARVRVALLYELGNAWTLDRTAVSPWLDATLDAGSTYRLRQPSVLALGATVQVSRKLLLVAEADRVSYGEIQSALIIRQGAHSRDDYVLVGAWEPRGGLELSLPFTKLSLQLRAGAERLAAGGLAYQGGDPVELAAFPGSPARVGWTAGAAVVTGGFRLDLGARGAGERPAFLAGATARF